MLEKAGDIERTQDEQNPLEPVGAVRKGANAKSVEFRLLNPIDADIEAKETVLHILGQMPSLSKGLLPQQKVFLQVYYNSLFDLSASCVGAGIGTQQYRDWLKYDASFVTEQNIIIDLVKSKIQSISLQTAFYEKDPKLLMDLLKSLMPQTYGQNIEEKNEDEDLNILTEALKELE